MRASEGDPRRPAPAWLITDDYEDHEIGPLTSGKEAEVLVVERRAGDRSCWLIHKRYRPREVGQKGELEARGFQGSSTFVNDRAYREGWDLPRGGRERRAMARRSRFGRRLLAAQWADHEIGVMTRAWEAGVDVPFPVSSTEEGMLMEYLGDERGAAPELARARVGPDDLRAAFDQLVANLVRLASVGIVHADLSAYNLLWWRGRVHVIDFPQAVDQWANPNGFELLHRDVANVCRFFSRRGISCDADEVFGRVLDEATP